MDFENEIMTLLCTFPSSTKLFAIPVVEALKCNLHFNISLS